MFEPPEGAFRVTAIVANVGHQQGDNPVNLTALERKFPALRNRR